MSWLYPRPTNLRATSAPRVDFPHKRSRSNSNSARYCFSPLEYSNCRTLACHATILRRRHKHSIRKMDPVIKFGTSGWRAIIADDFTFANVRLATEAIGRYVKRRNSSPVLLVGYDTRF